MAREARRKEFSTASAVYNQLIIPKEFTLFFLSTQESFNLCKILLIHTKVSAPSKHRANNNHCNPCHGAPSRRALQYDARNLQKQKAPSPRELSPQVTEGVFSPIGDGAKCKDTTHQLRCHPPRGGGQTDVRALHKSWLPQLEGAVTK